MMTDKLVPPMEYGDIHTGIVERSKQPAARSVNALMTASYWEIGRHIVEFEQGARAGRQMAEEGVITLESG